VEEATEKGTVKRVVVRIRKQLKNSAVSSDGQATVEERPIIVETQQSMLLDIQHLKKSNSSESRTSLYS
jgi:hypothetical protein